MKQIYKKILSAAVAFTFMFSAAAVNAAESNSAITSLDFDENGNITMVVNKTTDDSAKGIIAVYNTKGVLEKTLFSEEVNGSGEKTLIFNQSLTEDNNIIKAFLWKSQDNIITLKPLSNVFVSEKSATIEPIISTSAPIQTTQPVTEGFKADFKTDSHSSVTVSETQDFTNAEENVIEAYARNGDTGEIDNTGSGQINFKIIAEDGYEVDTVSVSPANYKNLKLPSELGENTYRITKITGDITVTVTTKEAAESTPAPTKNTDSTLTPDNCIIHLLGDSINADGAENVIVDGTTATITAAGEYTIDGILNDGQIVVDSVLKTDEIIINLDGVNVTSSMGNAFDGKKGRITLVPTSKESIFKSVSQLNDTTGIYSKNDLAIKGDGILNVISEYGNGICCKNDIEIGVCDLSVDAAKNGIKGDESVKITKKNNSVTIISGGDGIKSDTSPSVDETGTYITGGTVTINGGNININANTTETGGIISNGDGIQADTLLSITGGIININALGDALKANASSVEYLEDETAAETPADGDGCIIITGGTITASAGGDGIKAVKNVTISDSADIKVTEAQEGIQVNEMVYATDGNTVLGFVEGEININGGKLDIICDEDGIQCGTGNISVTNGTITVNSQQDCIQSENILNISGGTFDLTAYGGAPQNVSSNNDSAVNSCKGIKAAKLIYISGGEFIINTYDDAVHSNHTVRISGGNMNIASGDDGIHGDSYLYISDKANIDITKSYEGIEAAKIYISGGETRVFSSDDGANAAGEEPTDSAYNLDNNIPAAALQALNNLNNDPENNIETFAASGGFGPGGNGGPNWGGEDSSSYGYLEVSGGLLYIEAEGDGFDSNGSALVSGGTVLVNGPTSGGNGVFDIGDNSGDTLTITGGTVIGAGTSDMSVTPDSTTQYYVVTSSGGGMGGRPNQSGSSGFSSQPAGKAFNLINSNGDEIVTYVPSKTYAWVFVSMPEMTSGSYTLNYGGNITDGTFTGKGSYGIVNGGTYSGSSSCTLTAQSK